MSRPQRTPVAPAITAAPAGQAPDHDDVASSWLSPGHAPRLGDARVSCGARVNLGAGRTARPFGWKGPQPPPEPALSRRPAGLHGAQAGDGLTDEVAPFLAPPGPVGFGRLGEREASAAERPEGESTGDHYQPHGLPAAAAVVLPGQVSAGFGHDGFLTAWLLPCVYQAPRARATRTCPPAGSPAPGYPPGWSAGSGPSCSARRRRPPTARPRGPGAQWRGARDGFRAARG